MRTRRGFTLLETAIVLAITAIGALLVIPQWPSAFRDDVGSTRPVDDTPGAPLAVALTEARQQAIRHRQIAIVRIDAFRGLLRMDTVGTNGRGVWRDTTLPLGINEMLVTADTAEVLVFRPTGAAESRPMALRHASGWLTVQVDPWNGEVTRVAR